LTDKAIQDWPLYSGQETSTRYVDMSKQPIIDPVGTIASREILDAWMEFYINSQEAVAAHIRAQYPKNDDEDDAVYQKAVKARTFDIMRGFLPAGITTQLSWHTNLRQAWDKLATLRHHPLAETKEVAETILAMLQKKYPNSFSHKIYDDQETYRALSARSYNYYFPEGEVEDFSFSTTIKRDQMKKYLDLIVQRPVKTNLPHFVNELGQVTFDFKLDYGSFRDIQRHRNGVCRMPLLTTRLAFNAWYLGQLPLSLRPAAEKLIGDQTEKIQALGTDDINKQYYMALGFNLPCRVTYALPAAVYVVELRSGKSVHPTLRRVAHKMHAALKNAFPELQLYSDLEKDDWDVRRGLQDIIKK
jgi:hypothetical protein